MKSTNLPSGAQRTAEVGLVWEEVLTAGAGTFEVQVQGSIRVRAIALSTVTIAGILAMTLEAGETEILNVGSGLSADQKTTVTVVVAGSANVQVALDNERGRRTK